MATSVPAPTPATRLASLDTYRGVTMLFMASEICNVPRLARQFPDNPIWQAIAFHTSHVAWTGGSAWDLIQPSFMFMVGVALPWSVANRKARGQTLSQLWGHAFRRALILILLGILLRSTHSRITYFTFEDVLTQIGLGYPFLFLLAWTRPRIQALAAASILIAYWAAFAIFPLPPAGFDWSSVGVSADWPHLQGFAAHWDKNWNFAAWADQGFLNLFPREKPFVFNGGGYLTLNFIPSLGTMIFGLLAGGWLKSERTPAEKFRWLAIVGVAGIAVGWLLGVTGICPVVKRIWTPSWSIFSSGWVCLLLAAFYWWIDMRGHARSAAWVRAVGMNSIAMYVMAHLWPGFLGQAIKTNFGYSVLWALPDVWLTFVCMFVAWLILWWICVWMDRKKLYIRI